MFKFTKEHILYVLTAIFFILISVFIKQHKLETEISQNIMKNQQEYFYANNLTENTEKFDKEDNEDLSEKSDIWQIEIPKIYLVANIKEGTTKEILNQYVGHFIQTAKKAGNVGLAAHNRGYDVNYFKDLKLLKEGDEIRYKYNEFEKTYEVKKNRIIKDTDWNFLENTEDDMLTLITCVENQPEYRRCIQAVEKEEEEQ